MKNMIQQKVFCIDALTIFYKIGSEIEHQQWVITKK